MPANSNSNTKKKALGIKKTAIESNANLLESRWLIYSFMEKELFVQLVMQKKFMKFWNVTYSGDKLRLEPTLKYEELYDELAQS